VTPDSKIFVAGHRGMVGSAIVRALASQGLTQILTRPRAELDLLNRSAVRSFFEKERPEFVIDAAARVGGIVANSEKPVEFLLENLTLQNNLIEAAADFGCAKLLFLGSSCIYPKLAPQPIREDALLTGLLEPTNDAYAIAKIAGIKLCQAYAREYGKNFLSAMPTNLYGPHDNFDLHTSHVLPALIRKIHEAKKSGAPEVLVWGTGTPRREFLHADDLADAPRRRVLVEQRQHDRLPAAQPETQHNKRDHGRPLQLRHITVSTGLSMERRRLDGTPVGTTS
jgi:GDP-L-fucose synthase